MQLRVILAVILSMLILIFFQKINNNQYTPAKSVQVTPNNDDKMSTDVVSEEDDDIDYSSENEKYQNKIATAAINTDYIKVVLTSEGTAIRALVIKDKDNTRVDLIRKNKGQNTLALEIMGENNWTVKEKTERSLISELTVKGIEATRELRIEDENNIKIKDIFRNTSKTKKEFRIYQGLYDGIGTIEDIEKENYMDNRAFTKIDGHIRSDADKGKYDGKIELAGLVNRYFIKALVDIDPVFDEMEIIRDKKRSRGCAGRMVRDDVQYPTIVLSGKIELMPGETRKVEQTLYAGLKEYKKLKTIDDDAGKILSFGIFGFLSRLFLNILIWFNSFTGNYGVAIILLTMVLQTFLFPLTAKSYKSMNAMKNIQPKINNIRTKYKDDPQRMNQEMLALYKRYNVNPFSGCLPILFQMPIFISLFTMLRSAAELRYAGFLWITDLSKADILFSSIPLMKNIPVIGTGGPLPFMMGIAMFFQQKMTGSTEGPQKTLTYMMPIMFTFLFMKFPSGLVLYWLSNSILTLVIQSIIKKKNA